MAPDPPTPIVTMTSIQECPPKSTHCIVAFDTHTADLPSSPTVLEASPGTTSITLVWSQPPGEIVDIFIIVYSYAVRGCPEENGQNITESVNGSAEALITLTGLEENADFFISILARNESGDSEPANITLTTLVAGIFVNPCSYD